MRRATVQLRASKYRLLPDLPPEAHEALKENIRLAGVLQSIIVDSDLNILDGKERYAIATELGIKHVPCEVLEGLSEEEKRHQVLMLNCARRQLTREQRTALIEAELRRNPKVFDRVLGRLIGVSPTTVAKVRARIGCVQTGQMEREGIRAGKPYTFRRASGTVAQVRTIARDLKLGGEQLKALIPHEKQKLGAKVANIIREKWQEPTDFPAPKHYVCDFRELPKLAGLQRHSVHLIYTDPLYHKDYVWQYGALAALAAEYLVDGGVLATYAGQSYIDQIIPLLTNKLSWVCSVAVVYGKCLRCVDCNKKISSAANATRQHGVRRALNIMHRMIEDYVPLLVCSKGAMRMTEMLHTVYHSAGNPQDHYQYEKPLEEVEHFIKHLTKPGQTVLDCFMGSGTSGIACHNLGRGWIGGDIQPECSNIFKRRCRELGIQATQETA